jgi:hypothetical protein
MDTSVGFVQEPLLNLQLQCQRCGSTFFPNPKLQNAKLLTVTLPNFKSSNVQTTEWPNFRTVKL